MKFTEFCKDNNLQLLRDDLKFIKFSVLQLDSESRKRVLRGYADLWLQTLKDNESSLQAQNLARRTCNKWLLERCNGEDAVKRP